jgi:KUP system potassium uptake protein
MKTSGTPRFGLVVSALGAVFGDIGTSPLYAFQATLNASPETSPQASLGIASLIIWSLLAIATCKYVLLVMRADYKGEGGIFALLALLGATPRKLRNLLCLRAPSTVCAIRRSTPGFRASTFGASRCCSGN